ncbi:MAG: DapH/DapD/GlmU-related protein [Candidatus Bathyarchaeia archaeon]
MDVGKGMVKDLDMVHPTAKIGGNSKLGEGNRIGAYAIIDGDVMLGDGVSVGAYTEISGKVKIGGRTWIGSHCVIGHPIRGMLWSGESDRGTVQISDRCTIRSGSVIYDDVDLGEGVELGHSVMIREGVTVGRHSLIGTGTILDGHILIGRNVRIQTGVYISSHSIIEDKVFIGPRAVLLNDKYMMQREYRLKGPKIHSGVSVGGNSVILPGVEIGEGSIIGAGAVVTRDVPPRTIYAGIPAKKLRDVPPEWGIKLP